VSRGWHISDLSGDDRRIAEGILDRLFASAPGSDEERAAYATFDRFDRMLCERDGWKRFGR
jgi:hypothetical protein